MILHLSTPPEIRTALVASMLRHAEAWSTTTELAAMIEANRQRCWKALAKMQRDRLVECETTGTGSARFSRWRLRGCVVDALGRSLGVAA